MRNPAAWVLALRGWQPLGLAAAAGAVSTLAMPPAHVAPVLFFTLPILLLLVEASGTWRRALHLGWWFGAGYFATGLYWIGNALEIVGVMPVLAAPLPLAAAVYIGAACAVYRLCHATGAYRIVVFASLWVGFEWLRGHLFTGFPWNLLGYSWGFSDAISQFAAFAGAYGLSFVTVLAALTPALLVGRPLGTLAGWRPVLLAVSGLACLWLAGQVRLSEANDAVVEGVKLRIVQANIDQRDKWRADQLVENFVTHMTMSEQPGSDTVNVFIWPETAMPYFLEERPAHTVTIGRLAPQNGVVLTGSLRRDLGPDGAPRYYNSLVAIAPNGMILGAYDKVHLVPFGEYVPMRWLFARLGVEKLVEGAGDFSPGAGLKTLHLTPLVPPVAPLICYEGIFPRASVVRGERPGWLLNVTNDAWYGKTAGPYQHFAITRFRAIEEGLPIIRAAGSGISGIVDAYGRVVAKLGLGKKGILDGRLPAAISPTIYARFGDRMVIALVALALLPKPLVTIWRRRKSANDSY